jgi:hypothetical protein
VRRHPRQSADLRPPVSDSACESLRGDEVGRPIRHNPREKLGQYAEAEASAIRLRAQTWEFGMTFSGCLKMFRSHPPGVRGELRPRRSEPCGDSLNDPGGSKKRVSAEQRQQGKQVDKDLPGAERREPGRLCEIGKKSKVRRTLVA